MNWKSLRLVACAFVASLAVVGCSKEDARDVAGGEGSKDQNVKINLNLDIEDLTPEVEREDDEFRLSIKDRPKVGGKNNGVQFVFDTLANSGKGEKVKLHTYFRQGTTIKVGKPIDIYVKGMKTVGTTNTPVWSGLGDLSVPAGIDLSSSEDIFVAGAIGVKSIDASGKAVIEPANVAIDAENSKVEATAPMYFPEIKLNKTDTTLSKSAHLRFYGALVEIELKNNMYEPLLLNQVVMRTDAFTTKGSMKLTTATETKAPDWEPVQYPTKWIKVDAQGNLVTGGKKTIEIEEETALGTTIKKKVEVDIYLTEDSRDQTISFPSDRLGKGGVKKAFLWVKPADYTGRKNLKLWVREGNYAYSPEARHEAITKTYNVKKLETKVYRLPQIEAIPNPELIYTELNRDATNVTWEIYNPTNKDIDLGDFYHNRLLHNNSGGITEKMSTNLLDSKLALIHDKHMRSGSRGKPLLNAGFDSRVSPPRSLILKSGETALYVGGDISASESMKSKATYIFKFQSLVRADLATSFRATAGRREMYQLSKGGSANDNLSNVVDVFFYFKNPSSRRTLNIVNYSRRPDRNFGRKYWAPGEDGPNCDWVYRTMTNVDAGFRFGWYRNGSAINWLTTAKGPKYKYFNYGNVGQNDYIVGPMWTIDVAH